jgi:FixJ family two-component response regulator
MERTHLHILGGGSRARAEQARIAFALGHHAEVYGSLDELLERPPTEGILLASDGDTPGGVPALLARLGLAGIWLPVVMTAEDCAVDRVVDAIRSGAIDYLPLPLEMGTFARRLARILSEAGPQIERRRRELDARHQINELSRRERQVLECLASGRSNKLIARDLGISPRTVEIHRANMMTKLGAGHPADAVRLWMDAHFEAADSAPKEARQVDRTQVETIGRRQESSEVEPGWEPRRAHV